ncbi:MAG TPA: phosphatidate cytidylyltransferase [Actinomycetes bacterium]|nr:phosphatidate cytidylyltransferase [Actinomycetes bacterium]
MSSAAPAARANRAGRNLPVAIAVGVALAALVLGTLYTVQEFFVALVVLAVVVAAHELCGVLRRRQIHVPLTPLVAGSAVMLISAYADGMDALTVALGLTLAAVAASRFAMPGSNLLLRDLAVGSYVVVYLPLLASFAMVMLAASDGPDRLVVFILAVALSDTGGYAAGVLFGRHKLAPRVSPAKSWEGLGGSLVMTIVGTAVSVPLLLDGAWWQGALIGAAVVVTATLGDLGESLLKRDLGVKDMGSLLPEHGGVMDRLDSLLPTAPVVALLLAATIG